MRLSRILGLAIFIVPVLVWSAGCAAFDLPRDMPGNANVSGRLANIPAGRLPDPEYGKVLPPKEGAYIGAFQPDAPFNIDDIEEFTAASKKKPALLMWFQPWGQLGRRDFFLSLMEEVRGQDMVPIVSWEPWDPGTDPRALQNPETDPRFRLKKIADGDFDSYIRFWARGAKFYGGPIMIRPMHEMNGDWYPWGGTVNGNRPADFVKAWRHIHDIFEEIGATNVTWVWSVNAISQPRTKENAYEVYYPGDDYVDWIAISGFNFGSEESWSRWQNVDQLYSDAYHSLKEHKKPYLFIELGSTEKGGSKAEWMEKTFTRIQYWFPEAKGFVWYNAFDAGRNFRIDSTQSSAAAFSKMIASPYYVSQPNVEKVETQDAAVTPDAAATQDSSAGSSETNEPERTTP